MDTNDECNSSKFALALCRFIYILRYSFASNQLFYLAFRQHSMVALLESIHKLDKKFMKLNIKFQYGRLRVLCISSIIFSFLLATIIFSSLLYLAGSTQNMLSGTITYLLILFPLKYGVGFIVGFYLLVYIKYYALNELISKLSFNRKKVENTLENCAFIHLELYRCMKLIEKLYSFVILGNTTLFSLSFLQFLLTFLKLNENRRLLYVYLLMLDVLSILIMGVFIDLLRHKVRLNVIDYNKK